MDDTATAGWTRESLRDRRTFRIPYTHDHAALAVRLRRALEHGPGFAVVTGTPVAALAVRDAQAFAVAMLGPLGTALVQGRGGDRERAWLVRDEGVSAHTGEGRFHENAYTSKSRGYLHLHNDRAVQPFGQDPDLLALFTHRRALRGGASLLLDGRTLHQLLAAEHPRALSELSTPYPVDRRHVTPLGEPEVIQVPVFDTVGGRMVVRCNTKRIETAAALTGQPLPEGKQAALDTLKRVLARPSLRIRILLDDGDCLLTDDRRILHGRTAYEDDPAPDRRRCLIRLMLHRHPN
ncbi:TauD/TfdA family dioxygenase [Streptomyces sp. NBC_01214]|uniref:TauD/TfdA family dioxygenase n=1 Tax=Streptomyces sp. NBC_01214 TaxID=2903777 RepID=UPI002259410D|nr:TauD/TfdA family dioxygenase [Streptomyces sp. NBC_01214]MCX4808619.1 TauD/TfdA family dioxygenase [Streptomyces sp. NBC_01214]